MEINRSNTSMENYDKMSSFTNGDILTNLPSDYDQSRGKFVKLDKKNNENLTSKFYF